MTVQRPHIITCRLSDDEWEAFQHVMARHKLRMNDLLHSLVVDAIADEAEHVRRKQQAGCKVGPETSKGRRAAA